MHTSMAMRCSGSARSTLYSKGSAENSVSQSSPSSCSAVCTSCTVEVKLWVRIRMTRDMVVQIDCNGLRTGHQMKLTNP